MPVEQSDPERAAAIVHAATEMFARYGYRHASMNKIAEEARVAKATLYAYFSDKQSLFVATTQSVCEGFLAGARLAAASDKPGLERLLEVLIAKYTRLFELVHSQPHGQELIASKDQHCAALVVKADRQFRQVLEALVTEVLAQGLLALEAPAAHVCDLLHWAALGISHTAKDVKAHRKALRALLRTLGPSASGPSEASPSIRSQKSVRK